MRLNGVIEAQYCFSVIGQGASFNSTAQASCVNHYLDPCQMLDPPSTYLYDCSFGCKRCVYAQNLSGMFYCKAEATIIKGCPPPPSSPLELSPFG